LQQHPYFIKDRVVVLAHRGLTPPTENTIEAFGNAINAGADYLETDIRVTADGVAVLTHDKDLRRVFGDRRRVRDVSLAELRTLTPIAGGHLATLAEVLLKFPTARFNLDIKENAAIKPTVAVIEEHSAHHRVLVSSFSNRRRLRALKMFSKPVATSASATVMVKAKIWEKLGVPLDQLLKGIGAVQVPPRMYGLKFNDPFFIKSVKDTKTQIHFWTINDEDEILELLELGADGIVTDNTPLAIKVVEKF